MLYNPTRETPLDGLADELRLAPALTAPIVSHLIAAACPRLSALHRKGQAARFDRLVADGAWTEIALALLALERPAWTLRRLVREDGEWLCSLSMQPNLPAPLDDTADASHATLPLAIVSAFLEACRRAGAARQVRLRHVKRPAAAVCCDDVA
jgi:hypothetical protein